MEHMGDRKAPYLGCLAGLVDLSAGYEVCGQEEDLQI